MRFRRKRYKKRYKKRSYKKVKKHYAVQRGGIRI